MRAQWRYQRQSAELERRFRDARDTLAGEVPMRVATADDAALVERVRGAEAAFATAGFRMLGDVIVGRPDGTPAVVLRALASDTAVAIYSLLLVESRGRWSVVSYGADASHATRRGPFPHLAEPPFAHVQTLAADVAIPILLDKHRAFAPAGETIATAAELIAAFARFRAKTIAWRAAQPPDQLLDADLRAVLGDEAFAKVGKAWARRLRAHLPQATARRL